MASNSSEQINLSWVMVSLWVVSFLSSILLPLNQSFNLATWQGLRVYNSDKLALQGYQSWSHRWENQDVETKLFAIG